MNLIPLRPTPLHPAPLHRNPHVAVVPTTQRWHSVTISPYLYALVGLVLLFGTVQTSMAIGYWTTSGRVTGSGAAVMISGNDPLEIKGWMTIEQVATAYQVPLDELKAATGIPADVPGSTELKQVEKLAPGFEPQTVRDWLLARQKQR